MNKLKFILIILSQVLFITYNLCSSDISESKDKLNTKQTNASRIATYRNLSQKLESLSNKQLLELLEIAPIVHSGIGGTSVLVKIDGVSIFAKKIPLTDIERLAKNIMSTENLFELPIYYQYGIGSAGFGAWRELSTHIMSTDWVLRNECPNFLLMYHWRILPDSTPKTLPISVEGYRLRFMFEHPTTDSLNLIKQGELGLFCEDDKLFCKVHDKEKMQILRASDTNAQGIDSGSFDRIIKNMQEGQRQQHLSMTETDKAVLLQFISLCGYIPVKLDRLVEYWGGSSTIRARLEAREKASANIVLFLEYIPETLQKWLDKQFTKEGNVPESAIEMVESDLKTITSFIKDRGLLHLDMHFNNILTDGHRLYLIDFGLATSFNFKLSEAEINFVQTHRDYDQRYAAAMWVNWLGIAYFGKNNLKAKLHQYAAGKGERLASSLATAIITRDAHNWIMLDNFLKQLKDEIRSGKIKESPMDHD